MTIEQIKDRETLCRDQIDQVLTSLGCTLEASVTLSENRVAPLITINVKPEVAALELPVADTATPEVAPELPTDGTVQ